MENETRSSHNKISHFKIASGAILGSENNRFYLRANYEGIINDEIKCRRRRREAK